LYKRQFLLRSNILVIRILSFVIINLFFAPAKKLACELIEAYND